MTHVVEAVVLKPHDKGHDQTIVKRGGGKHKHDDHGGAWKVAFADFCLALMCLFLVLWLMAARNTESLEQILTEADGAKTDQGKGVMPQQVGGPRGSLIDPLCNMMKQLVNSEGSNKETVKVVLVTHVAGKPPLLAIDAGRRLVALNIKPSFAQLERWINDLEGRDSEPADDSSRRGGRGAKAA